MPENQLSVQNKKRSLSSSFHLIQPTQKVAHTPGVSFTSQTTRPTGNKNVTAQISLGMTTHLSGMYPNSQARKSMEAKARNSRAIPLLLLGPYISFPKDHFYIPTMLSEGQVRLGQTMCTILRGGGQSPG